MITINNNMYVLDTDNTSYAFAVLGSGQLEHLYYGRKLHANEAVMTEKHTFIPGNTNVSVSYTHLTLPTNSRV